MPDMQRAGLLVTLLLFFGVLGYWGYRQAQRKATKEDLQQVAAGLFVLWVLLLLPWVILAPLSGVAFDGGPDLAAYACVAGIWTYPISVAAVWRYKNDIPAIALLPLLNIAAWAIAGASL
jgi:hypothetical protein